MRVSTIAPVALVVLLVAGCRSGGNRELIERELRFQESELYRLHDELDETRADLEETQRENESLKKQLAGGESGAAKHLVPGALTPPAVELPPGIEGPSRHPEHLRRPTGKAPQTNVEAPLIEPGVEILPGEQALPEMSKPEEVIPDSAPRRRIDAQGASHIPAAAAEQRVAKIVLNKQLTRGHNGDERTGDGALSVVFEPRNAAGQFVKAAGEISIVVLDPAVAGAGARVARWDFKSDEASAHFRSSASGRGYHFDLSWPGRPPVHSALELFVRLQTTDGQRLVASQSIRVEPATEPPREKWTAVDRSVPLDQARSGAAAQDAPAVQLAARDGQRPRLFSRMRSGTNSSSKTPPSPQVPDAGGTLDISIPDSGSSPNPATNPADGSGAPKTSRLLERSKLLGGPGVFDGSRIRSLTGSRDAKPPQGAGPSAAQQGGSEAPPYRIGNSTGNRGGEAPAYQAPGTAAGSGGNAPRFAPSGDDDQGPTMPPINIPEPIGGPAASDDAPQVEVPEEPPAAPRTARPIWRPYR